MTAHRLPVGQEQAELFLIVRTAQAGADERVRAARCTTTAAEKAMRTAAKSSEPCARSAAAQCLATMEELKREIVLIIEERRALVRIRCDLETMIRAETERTEYEEDVA